MFRGGPSDPVQRAVRSMQLVGFLSCAVGGLVAYVLGVANPYQLYRKFFFVGGVAVWLAPGIVYLVASSLLRRENATGAIIGFVAAGFQGICALAALVGQFFLRPISAVPVMLGMTWLAVTVELLLELRGSFIELRLRLQDQQRGFIPLPVQPPIPDNDRKGGNHDEASTQG